MSAESTGEVFCCDRMDLGSNPTDKNLGRTTPQKLAMVVGELNALFICVEPHQFPNKIVIYFPSFRKSKK